MKGNASAVAALRASEAARVALLKEQRRLAKGGTKADKALVARLLDKLDAGDVMLLSAIEQARLIERQQRYIERARHPERALKVTNRAVPKAPKGKKAPRPTVQRTRKKNDPRLLGERELKIRGFWDRYPKEEQKRYPKRFRHFPSAFRRGPTAYDLLVSDYMSFTKAQRKHLQLRVAYGVVHETGLLLDNRAIKRKGLIVNLSADMNEALIAVGSTLLVRAGLIYVPIGWKNLDDDASIPLGIEWWLVDD